jgi:hypothetical protein
MYRQQARSARALLGDEEAERRVRAHDFEARVTVLER